MDRLELYAKENNIPIMQKEGIEFLVKYIKENKIQTILEIGTAIGYSAINMAKIDKNIKITTIERDKTRYLEAIKNIKEENLENQITVIFDDALNINLDQQFDLIFIDGAKAGYIKFFEKFKSNLNKNGTIISDNLDFHGLTKNVDAIKSKNLKALVKKINNYRDFLEKNEEFNTKILKIGDGIAVTTPK